MWYGSINGSPFGGVSSGSHSNRLNDVPPGVLSHAPSSLGSLADLSAFNSQNVSSLLEKPFYFPSLLEHQSRALQVLRPLGESALLFAEVQPVITLGARQLEMPNEKSRLRGLAESIAPTGMQILAGERGGLETWHGPGQWIGYVVSPLEKFTGDRIGVRKAVYLILETVLKVAQHYLPEAKIKEGDALGIWCELGKVASIGIRIREGYITGGFSLNCFPTELSFHGINPCGLAQSSPGFLFPRSVATESWKKCYAELPLVLAESFKNNFIV